MATSLDRHGWSEEVGTAPSLEFLDPESIEVDEEYQRTTSLTKARRIASEFRWDAFGVVVVSRRGKRYFATDGGHRVMAARLRPDVDRIPCAIFDDLAIEEEAKSFVRQNKNRKQPASLDLWKAQIRAGDADCLAVQALCASYGFTVSGSKTPNCIGASQALLGLLKGGMLQEVLHTVRSCWPGSCQAAQGPFLQGLSEFLKRYARSSNPLPVTKMLKKLRSNPAEAISHRAGIFVKLLNSSLAQATTEAMVEAYNKRLQADRRLPRLGE